jgi:hypothetical protein
MRQLTLPMVLSPNSVYLLQVEWFRAGGNVLTLEGKDGVHVFPLGRWLRAFRGEGDRRSVTPLRLGFFPNRTEARLGVQRHPALLLRRAELAGRQRNPDPKLTGLLGELDWVFTTTVSGGYLWEDPFEGHRLFFHGLGEKGRAYRVRLNMVDGVGAVPVFNYEGSADVKSRFKIYAHLTAAVRRVLGGRDVHLFPLKGTFFQPEEVVRAIGDLRPNETDVAFGGGVPDSSEKMHQTLERLIAILAATPQVWADGSNQGRISLMRDQTFEQNLRWEASADKTITPAKVLRWIMGLRGQSLSAPSQTEFQPIFNTQNGHIRIIAAIAYKF